MNADLFNLCLFGFSYYGENKEAIRMFRLCNPRERKEFAGYMFDRFGIAKQNFAGFELYAGDKGRLFLGTPCRFQMNFISIGIQAARFGRRPKPSSALLRAFGSCIKKNRISLTKENAVKYMKGENLAVQSTEATEGYVALFYNEYCLGCGLLRNHEMKNMLPKAKRTEVKYM